MSCYLVAVSKITDQAKVDEYLAAALPTLADHTYKLLVFTTEAEVVEGSPPGTRTVILEFPDRAALRAWYDSPEYQKAKELRLAGTDGFVVLADGA